MIIKCKSAYYALRTQERTERLMVFVFTELRVRHIIMRALGARI